MLIQLKAILELKATELVANDGEFYAEITVIPREIRE